MELLRQMNDQHAKLYEQLDMAARDVEESNHRLVQDNRLAQTKINRLLHQPVSKPYVIFSLSILTVNCSLLHQFNGYDRSPSDPPRGPADPDGRAKGSSGRAKQERAGRAAAWFQCTECVLSQGAV